MWITNRTTATASIPLNVSLAVASKCATSVPIDFFFGVSNPDMRVAIVALDVLTTSTVESTICQLSIVAPI